MVSLVSCAQLPAGVHEKRGEQRGKGGQETYRAVFPPPVENVADVKGCFELVWHAGPDPLIAQAAAALLVQEPLAVNIGHGVAVAMAAVLDGVVESGVGHANVNARVYPFRLLGQVAPPAGAIRRLQMLLRVAAVARLPQLRDELAHGLVVDADGLGMDEDADAGKGG
jgi:hypothetical protein